MKRLALLLLAFTGLMSACSKDDPVPQDGSLTPDSPEGREKQRIRLLRFSNLSIPDSQISPISQFQENRHNNAVARDSCFATRKFFR